MTVITNDHVVKPDWFNSLPKCFQDKIKIDRGIKKLKQRKVIDFFHGRKLVLMQQTFRYRCQDFIKRQFTHTGNAA